MHFGFFSGVVALSGVLWYYINGDDMELKFKNGKFRILMVADTQEGRNVSSDTMKLIEASSELQFRNFISIVALRTAKELHYDEIAGAVGIDVRTCKRWISILQTSGIIYLLQPYLSNISNRIIKAPKLYFMDTGLCAYLCKWPNAEMLEDCAMSGAFFETYVVSEIIKNF